MARTIKHYLNANPAPQRKPGPRTATARKRVSVGWAWNPDDKTRKALARGTRKFKKAKDAEHDEIMETAKMATKKRAGKKAPVKKTKTAKKSTAKKVEKKAANTIPLKKICQQLKIDPKLARRKLRAEGVKGHDPKARWEFTAAQAKKATDILKA